jgi:hypothetical protein
MLKLAATSGLRRSVPKVNANSKSGIVMRKPSVW